MPGWVEGSEWVAGGGAVPDFLLQYIGVGNGVAHVDLVAVIDLEALLQLGSVAAVSNETQKDRASGWSGFSIEALHQTFKVAAFVKLSDDFRQSSDDPLLALVRSGGDFFGLNFSLG